MVSAEHPPSFWRRAALWCLGIGFPPLIGGLAFAQMFGKNGVFVVGALLAVCSVCAVTDVFQRKIYNAISYPAFLEIVLLNAFLGTQIERWGTIGLAASLTGAAVCFAITLLPYLISQGGAGDVKLAAIIGAALGAKDGFFVLCFGFVFAALAGLVSVVGYHGPWKVVKSMFHRLGHWFVPLWVAPASEEERKLLKEPIPLAPCFLLAAFIVVNHWFEYLK